MHRHEGRQSLVSRDGDHGLSENSGTLEKAPAMADMPARARRSLRRRHEYMSFDEVGRIGFAAAAEELKPSSVNTNQPTF
jgi:hypothetical protein